MPNDGPNVFIYPRNPLMKVDVNGDLGSFALLGLVFTAFAVFGIGWKLNKCMNAISGFKKEVKSLPNTCFHR